MVLIPEGNFNKALQMGIPQFETDLAAAQDRTFTKAWDNDARPQRADIVFGKPFYIGETPITMAQYAVCEKEAKCTKHDEPNFDKDGWDSADSPVVGVNFKDANDYIAWLNDKEGRTDPANSYRLPSEAEWEYAARAGKPTARYWGNEFQDRLPFVVPRSERRTITVKKVGPNDFGLYDMLGHVWQWTAGCMTDSLSKLPKDGNAGVAQQADCMRVVRGSSWFHAPATVRVGLRGWGV